MNQKTNNRMQMLTAMAIFIAAVFIWGIVQWQATGVKEPTVQKALATQKKVNNVSDKKVNIEALTKILLQDIKYETKLNLMDDSVVEGIVSLQKDSKVALYMGEGTYSDEVLVVTASSEEKAKKDQGAVEDNWFGGGSMLDCYLRSPVMAGKASQDRRNSGYFSCA